MNAKKARALRLAVLTCFLSPSLFFLEYRTHADSPVQAPQKPAGPQKPGQQPPGERQPDQKMPGMKEQQENPPGPSLTLADLEQMALKSNPTFGQAEALIRSAEGRRHIHPVTGERDARFRQCSCTSVRKYPAGRRAESARSIARSIANGSPTRKGWPHGHLIETHNRLTAGPRLVLLRGNG